METEFQILRRWLPRINESVKAGQGVPKELFRYIPRTKFNRNHIYEAFLAVSDRDNSSNDEWKKENISAKRARLFSSIDHLINSEYYYIILYYFLLKRSYEQELNRIIESISSKPSSIRCFFALRQQVERSFNKAVKKLAQIDITSMEKISQLKSTFLNQFDTELGLGLLPELTYMDIFGKIAIIFQTHPEGSGFREKELLRLAKRLSKSVLPKRPSHRPSASTINQLIVFMRKYFGTTGITPNKAHEFIAQTINYCFSPKDPFNRNHIRLRFSDQWLNKGREKS